MVSNNLKQSLASQLKGSVLVLGDEGYEESLKRWAGNSEKKAAYVALVESAKDISNAVLIILNSLRRNLLYPRSLGLQQIISTLRSKVVAILALALFGLILMLLPSRADWLAPEGLSVIPVSVVLLSVVGWAI